jgi:hypothetical protein
VHLLSLPVCSTAPVHLNSHGLPNRVKYSEGYEMYCFEISSSFPTSLLFCSFTSVLIKRPQFIHV